MFEVAIGLGVLTSLFFLEAFGIAAGGIVVCGYIALYLHEPLTILVTLAISFAVYGIVEIPWHVHVHVWARRMVYISSFGIHHWLDGSFFRAVFIHSS